MLEHHRPPFQRAMREGRLPPPRRVVAEGEAATAPIGCVAPGAPDCLACRSLTSALASAPRLNPTRHTIHPVATRKIEPAAMSESNSQPPDTNMEVNDELDRTVDDEIKQDATQLEADAMNLDGANDADAPAVNGVAESAANFEARIPAKKDATLREFLGKMDEYAPIVCSPSHPPFE